MGVDWSPDCAAHRVYLSEQFVLAEMLALWWLRPRSENTLSLSARDHFTSCAECRNWFDAQVPPQALRRQSRLLRYCCPRMFVAVEEADKLHDVVVRFSMIRDEPCWMIDGKQTYAAHCPWCGKSLPEIPFIERDDLRSA